MSKIVVAGQDVADRIAMMRLAMVQTSRSDSSLYDSNSLCRFQERMAITGYVEAEIVLSNYGYSVRYASGLQNFGLIYSSRAKQVDGTLEGAIAAAKRWQAENPARRYVTRWEN